MYHSLLAPCFHPSPKFHNRLQPSKEKYNPYKPKKNSFQSSVWQHRAIFATLPDCIKPDTILSVGRQKRGGYIFETYSGDHRPYHVHVYRDDEFIGRFDIENQIAMDKEFSSQVLKYLQELGYKEPQKDD